MEIQDRIDAFAALGEKLRNALSSASGMEYEWLREVIKTQHIKNPWFTPENVTSSIKAIAGELTRKNLVHWTDEYPELHIQRSPIKAGVIMAGNIPLAGFHDFLSVLISGNHLVAKTSSKDAELILKIGDILCSCEPRFDEYIEFTDGLLKNFDVVIATGSNNSSRYFDQYFGKYPNIIRKNRNSIALIDGNETKEELAGLGNDIFLYFGLGCRSVSKVYIPEEYDIRSLAGAWESFSDCINHSKYANNYDFNKAVYLINREKFLDNGYLLLKEDKGLSSPVAVLYFEYYRSLSAFRQETELLKDKIQCITGHGYVPFGEAQSPLLWDYADGIDTLEFLSKKNKAGIL